MIHFPCPDCKKKLGVPEAHSGKLIVCPNCSSKVRVPVEKQAAVETDRTDPLPRAPKSPQRQREIAPARDDNVEETEAGLDDVDDRPSRSNRDKARRHTLRDEADEDEQRGWLTADRIRGLCAIVAGAAVAIFALLYEKLQEDDYKIHKIVAIVLGAIIVIAGVYYLVKKDELL